MERGSPAARNGPSFKVFGMLVLFAGLAALSLMGVPTSAGNAPSLPSLLANPLLLSVGLVLVTVLVATLFLGQRKQETETESEQTSSNLPPPSKVLANTHIRTITADRPSTRFSDVAGVDEAKEELAEVVDFLKFPAKFASLGARVPKGVLLVGPPGTGKTLLARAVAGEAGVPFLSVSGSEFVELYVGVGAARVRSLFQEARRQAPCIVFIDEIDAVGRRRGSNWGMSHEEREQTLNQILVEMDGFDPRTNVMVIAATNRADVLDPALLRPGRFDRQIALDLPDARGRLAILKIHARGKPMSPGVDLEALAKQTSGLSGADLENLVNEAAILAARHGKESIGQEELEEALDRVVAGPRRKSRLLTAREKEITAVHEIGHALVAYSLPHADKVQKVSIISRGATGGYTRIVPEEDRNMWSVSQFKAVLAAAMGGHVAEEMVFGEVTTGPSNDLQRATEIARRMVTEFGMSKRLGPLSLASPNGPSWGEWSEYRGFGEEVAREIDQEVRRLVNEARSTAWQILSANRDTLERAARLLVEKETLGEQELAQIFSNLRPAPQSVGGDSTPAAGSQLAAESGVRRRILALFRRRLPSRQPPSPPPTSPRRPVLACDRRARTFR